MKESYIKRAFKNKVEKIGGLCIDLSDEIGRPDTVVLFKDIFFFVEFKSAIGRLSLAQKRAIDVLLKKGFQVAVVNSTLKRNENFFQFIKDRLIKQYYNV